MTITEKVAYLRGLSEGMAIDEKSNEGRMFKAIIDVLDDMAFSIADFEDGLEEVADQIEAIDEDLDSLEEDFYGDDDDDDDDDEEIYEITCPSCGEEVCLDYDTISEGSIECPNCGELLEFDLDDCECGGDCTCEDKGV